MSEKSFRAALTEWVGEMYFQNKGLHADGTPKMGKFESEELYRQGKKFLETPEVEPKFGELTNAQRERLEMLAEEAAEVVQACTKILRHGFGSYHPNAPKISNRSLLMKELMDLWTVYERMVDYGDLTPINFYGSANVWAGKLRWTHHQPEFSHPTLPREGK